MYDIKYFHDQSGEELIFTEENPLQIMGFEYRESEKITKEMYKDGLRVFMEDVLECRDMDGPFCSEISYIERLEGQRQNKVYFDRFTKLVYLYLDLLLEKSFMYPIVLNDDVIKSGHGRSLLAWRYFPEKTFDFVVNSTSFGIGSEELMQDFVDKVKNGTYWKNIDISDKTIILNIENVEDYKLNDRDLFFIKSIEFVDDNYYQTFQNIRPDYFLENSCKIEIWHRMKDVIINYKLQNNIDGFFDILDNVIFDTLPLAKKLYTWK